MKNNRAEVSWSCDEKEQTGRFFFVAGAHLSDKVESELIELNDRIEITFDDSMDKTLNEKQWNLFPKTTSEELTETLDNEEKIEKESLRPGNYRLRYSEEKKWEPEDAFPTGVETISLSDPEVLE